MSYNLLFGLKKYIIRTVIDLYKKHSKIFVNK